MTAVTSFSAAVWRSRLTAYGLAVFISGLTLLGRLSLSPWAGDHPVLILFIIPIIISAFWGGLGPGLLATIINGLGVDYYFLAPTHSFSISDPVLVGQWTVFIITGILISALCESLHRSNRRIEAARQLHSVTLASIGDAVITTDCQGRVTFLNGEAERLTEWNHAGAQGRPLAEIFRAVDEHTREPATGPVSQVLQTGQMAGRANHTLLLGQNGRETTIDHSSAPIRENDGRVAGLVLVFRDCSEKARAQTQLSHSVSLLRTAMEASNNGLLVVDTAGRVTVFNTRFLEIWKIPEEIARQGDDQTVMKLALEQIPAAERDEFVRNVKEYYANPERVSFDTLYLKDGRIIERVSHPQRLDGKVIGRVWSFRDITERRKAEQAARDQERLLRQVIDVVPHFIFAKNRQSQHIFVNRACAEANGMTPEQMVGQCDRDFVTDKQQAENFMRDDREVIDSGRAKFIPEETYTAPDGTVHLFETTKFPFKLDDNQEPALLGVAVDITQRRAAEQQVRQLAVIVESSEDAIIGHDLACVITSWNRGAQMIFGYAASEMVGQSGARLQPPELKGEEVNMLARITRGERMETFQTDRLRKDGKRIRISATVSPLRDLQGNIVGTATIARDITRQQMLEEELRQAQKMEAIGQLAGGVAHDFNNILAVIQMQIELSKLGGNLSDEQAGAIEEIQVAANRGANLTRQLLLFSRRQRLQPRDLDLSESITGMTKMLRRILGEDIQIQFHYAPQPLLIYADAGMVDQVLMNLTLNSRDAMPGGGQLIIETAAVEIDEPAAAQSAPARPGPFVRLSVSDTGCGIPPEVLPRIFEPFFTTKEVGKGTGLGLATVFSIVQQHQGWINVTSEPGQGTTFDIFFPRQTGQTAPAGAVAATLATVRGGNETILLVEDDDALRASVHQCLSQLGYRLLEAPTAVAAQPLWELHRGQIALLLTDVVMPGGLSGKELGELLQQKDPALKVIYFSGYSGESFNTDFLRAGHATFLAKPFPAQQLARAVREVLDKK